MFLQNMPTASCCISAAYLQSRRLMEYYKIKSRRGYDRLLVILNLLFVELGF